MFCFVFAFLSALLILQHLLRQCHSSRLALAFILFWLFFLCPFAFGSSSFFFLPFFLKQHLHVQCGCLSTLFLLWGLSFLAVLYRRPLHCTIYFGGCNLIFVCLILFFSSVSAVCLV